MASVWTLPNVSQPALPNDLTHNRFNADIAATDLANITSRFSKAPYISQEVIWGSGEPIQPSEYVNIGERQKETPHIRITR